MPSLGPHPGLANKGKVDRIPGLCVWLLSLCEIRTCQRMSSTFHRYHRSLHPHKQMTDPSVAYVSGSKNRMWLSRSEVNRVQTPGRPCVRKKELRLYLAVREYFRVFFCCLFVFQAFRKSPCAASTDNVPRADKLTWKSKAFIHPT